MEDRSSKKPRSGNKTANRGNGRPDINQLAYMVVQQATGQAPKQEPPPEKNVHAVTLGRLGGLKGGKARADKLTPEERKEIAKKAAEKRWNHQQ
jgi:hypothetical protein